MGIDAFVTSVHELGWYWGCSEAAIGFHAQGYDPNTTGGVWDDERCWALHEKMTTPQHRQALKRKSDIEAVRSALPRNMDLILRRAFEPVSEHQLGGPIVWLQVKRMFTRGGVTLFALALDNPATLREFERAHKMDQDDAYCVSPWRIRTWMHGEAQKQSEPMARILTATEGVVCAALLRYDQEAAAFLARQAAEAKEKRDRAEYVDAGAMVNVGLFWGACA